MDRFKCEKCRGEFYLKSGGSCCGPSPPGPYFCPECGGSLHRIATSYIVSTNEWEVD